MSSKLSQSERDLMNTLYQDCNLDPSDIYKDKRGFKLITRQGIEKIQFAKNIKVTFEHIKIELEFCVIKAIGNMNGEVQETYGSASKLTSMNKYYPEMAEKRALSRVVLKLTKAYQHSVFGEDEFDVSSPQKKEEPGPKKKPKKGDDSWKGDILPFIKGNKSSLTKEKIIEVLQDKFIISMTLKKHIENECNN